MLSPNRWLPVLCLSFLGSCGTPYVEKSEGAYRNLIETIKLANKDGYVSPKEHEEIAEAQSLYYQGIKADYDATKGLDVWETLGIVAAAFVPGGAGIAAAINAWRNKSSAKRTASDLAALGVPTNVPHAVAPQAGVS